MLSLPHEVFDSGRYYRDMKILKILVSNSKRFRFYDIFKQWQIDDRVRAHPNTTYYIKITFGSESFTWICFLTQDTQK